MGHTPYPRGALRLPQGYSPDALSRRVNILFSTPYPQAAHSDVPAALPCAGERTQRVAARLRERQRPQPAGQQPPSLPFLRPASRAEKGGTWDIHLILGVRYAYPKATLRTRSPGASIRHFSSLRLRFACQRLRTATYLRHFPRPTRTY
ncbi:MAG: hypothetical protein K2M11_08795 [Paramuribaculum sp.]|nr:hypothetical protein [Paramuribaculum sp.]